MFCLNYATYITLGRFLLRTSSRDLTIYIKSKILQKYWIWKNSFDLIILIILVFKLLWKFQYFFQKHHFE